MRFALSSLEMAELDRHTVEELGVPARTLMEVAGRAVADFCAQRLAPGAAVAIACGTGNNGGDGLVAARALAERGFKVAAFVFGERERVKTDARAALNTLEKSGGVTVRFVLDAKALWEFAQHMGGVELAVDALTGTGLHEALTGLYADAVAALNESGRPVVAVDLPSGVDADTGGALGPAVQATATVTFAFAKRGHYLYPGAGLRGDLVVADIGIPRALAESLGAVCRVALPADGPQLLPRRKGSAHKGSFGHVVVLAGNSGTPGAAVLALAGALRAGAGLVSWAASAATVAAAPVRPPEVMLRTRGDEPVDVWAARVLEGATALVMGPGIGQHDRLDELTAVLARAEVPICLDADGLNLLAANPSLWKRARAPLVLTPHPMEMARLTGGSVADVERDRFASAVQLAASRHCAVVLKGAGTVVAEPDGSAAIIGAGNPGMATGGTGDVLAGVVGGLLAQGLAPGDAARAGALLHAVAGDAAAAIHGQAGLRASDLVEAMGTVLAAWRR